MIDVALNPADLNRVEDFLPESQVVVLDVLRATSTITTALHAGAKEVHLFGSLDAARACKRAGEVAGGGPVRLAGEASCLMPDDFDLGNSPREFMTEKVGGAMVLLATTNGTRAAVQVENARRLYAACLLNAGATATALLPQVDSLHTVLVCAGTGGVTGFEDVVGAGAILFALMQASYRTDLAFTDSAWLAYHTFAAVRTRLPAALRLGAGGINVMEAGLEDDIDFCARLDVMPIVIEIARDPLRAIAVKG